MDDVDRIDRRILRELQREGRVSNAELADRVGLSASACLRRVRELERSGVILGYRAVIDPKALGRGFSVFVGIGLAEHTKDDQTAFEKAMQAAPEVVGCYNVTGVIEYLLHVETEDLAAFKRFHTDVLGATPQVSRITSYVVMGAIESPLG